MSITPRGMSVQEAYRHYREGRIQVNRRYQRKLVWTLEEKRKLVDSILKRYPVPLILLLEKGASNGSQEYEVMDGLQRLDAIFSYIENRFSVKGKYFDVEQLSRAKTAADEGVFDKVSKPEKLLSKDKCADLVDYQLAVTTFPSKSEEDINSIFDRINSYGRQLSAQDRRQAGIVSKFNNLIRELASKIRGDDSPRVLNLSEISKISIAIEEDQDYGIQADECFWCRQGVLRRKELRDSRDEQLLADIAVSVLRDKPFPFSNDNLDEVYNRSTERHQKIESRLEVYGREKLEEDLFLVFNKIQSDILNYDNTKNTFRDLVNPEAGANPVYEDFFTVFLAYYRLIIEEGKEPSNSGKIMKALNNIHDKITIGGAYKSMSSREDNINITKGLIEEFFIESTDVAGEHRRLHLKIESILNRSRTETSLYEMKQGILDISKSATKINSNTVEKVAREASAVMNAKPSKKGYLVIGIADSEDDAERIQDVDSTTAIDYHGRQIVGVDREADRMGLSIDDYQTKFIQELKQTSIDEKGLRTILDGIDLVTYKEKSILLIELSETDEPISYDDSFYLRDGASSSEVLGASANREFLSQFSSSS